MKGYGLIDAADAEWVNQWRWGLSSEGYVIRNQTVNGRTRTIRLHRELLGLKFGNPLEGDHINLIKHDNRRINLRVVTRQQQMQNLPAFAGMSSSHRGVSWDSRRSRWRVRARVDGKSVEFGYFRDEASAAAAAEQARRTFQPYSAEALPESWRRSQRRAGGTR